MTALMDAAFDQEFAGLPTERLLLPPSPTARRKRISVAIVGVGPRGLAALEAILRLAPTWTRESELSITTFEPFSHPGAGAVYDPRQPDYLRMNFAAKHLDTAFDDPASQLVPRFPEWAYARFGERIGPDDFPARRLVGAYLHDRYRETVKQLKKLARYRCVAEPVQRLERRGSKWLVGSESCVWPVDHCLLTVGHGSRWRRPTGEGARPLRVFPVETNLSTQHVPPGSRVAVRGFSLTFIDACLALTEGRGGRFVLAEGELRYAPSGAEPSSIAPLSRTGRPMLPKPNAALDDPEGNFDELTAAAARCLNQTATPNVDELRDQVFELADALLGILRRRDTAGSAAQDCREWFERWTQPAEWDDRLAELRRASQEATGRRSPGPASAVGEAWRRLYPTLVDQLSYCQRSADWQADFAALAAEMERIAFGPPAINVQKLLALVDAGFVSQGVLLNDSATDNWRRQATRVGAQIVIDGVLPKGADTLRGEIQALLPQGPRLLTDENGGLITGTNGEAKDANGRPVDGLWVQGRSAEGWVLGHDTLNRNLHHHPLRQWAQQTVCRVAGPR